MGVWSANERVYSVCDHEAHTSLSNRDGVKGEKQKLLLLKITRKMRGKCVFLL